jgi:hypothetical protein
MLRIVRPRPPDQPYTVVKSKTGPRLGTRVARQSIRVVGGPEMLVSAYAAERVARAEDPATREATAAV